MNKNIFLIWVFVLTGVNLEIKAQTTVEREVHEHKMKLV